MDRKYQVNGLKKLCDYLERFIISMKQFEINKNKDNTKNKKKMVNSYYSFGSNWDSYFGVLFI